jgi:hypothetical protein
MSNLACPSRGFDARVAFEHFYVAPVVEPGNLKRANLVGDNQSLVDRELHFFPLFTVG